MVSFFGFHRGLMRSVCFFLSFAFRWFLGCLRFPFFPSPFVFRFPMGAFAFRGFRFSSVLACLCVLFPGAACPLLWLPPFSVVGFSIGGFMSFVRPQISFIDLLVSFSWLCLPSSFPVPHSFSLFRFSLRLRFPLPVLFLRVACVFLSVSWISIAVRPFRLRSPIPPLRITSSQCAIGRRRRAYRPRLSASSRTASSRVAWRRWSR